MPDSALAPDARFGEVGGGTDIYPDAGGVWHLCEEGEMTVSLSSLFLWGVGVVGVGARGGGGSV